MSYFNKIASNNFEIQECINIAKTLPDAIELPETEAVTVELSMASGDQVISPSEDKFLSKVTVVKPSTMLPENIKEGINIGGVVGTHVGGGGAGELPTLFAPTIAFADGNTKIAITDDNGGFVEKYEVYIDEVRCGEVATKVFAISDITPVLDTVHIFVKAIASLFNASENSNVVVRLTSSGTAGLEYKLYSNSSASDYYSVVSIGTAIDTDIVIPPQVDGIPVIRLESGAFKGNKSITSVIFPTNFAQIPDSSFSGCSSLAYVKLPTNLNEGSRRLGYQVFGSCTSLKELAIPGNFTEIGYEALIRSGLEVLDLTDYGANNSFPSMYHTASLPSTTIKEIRVPSGRKAGLSAMTNWSAYADKIVEV